jgi:hypothetical protein
MGAEPIFIREFGQCGSDFRENAPLERAAIDEHDVRQSPIASVPQTENSKSTPPDFSALPMSIERNHTSMAQIFAMAILLQAVLIGVIVAAVRLNIDSITYIILVVVLSAIPAMNMVAAIVLSIGRLHPGSPLSDDQEIITIGERHVSRIRMGVFGVENWTVPTSTFESICWNGIDRSHKSENGIIIELINRDRSKNIALYGSQDTDELSTLLYGAASALNLPITYRQAKHPDDYFILYSRSDRVWELAACADGGGGGYGG